MDSTDICKGELEISVPWDEVQSESNRVIKSLAREVRIPGFRPGKAPASVIKMRYADNVRQEVLEALIGKHFWKHAEDNDYHVIGQPKISDLKFEDNEPLSFKAAFEIVPDFELQTYKLIPAPFKDPEVADEDVEAQLGRVREQHASYRNLDPRPLVDGDLAVVSLESEEVDGAPKIEQSETMLVIAAEATLEDFTKNLTGKSPGDKLDFDVTYPDDFANQDLAGKSVPFHAEVKAIREKELPDLDDDFAADVGDFRTLDELRARIREEMQESARTEATRAAKDKIVDTLVERHDFPVPDLLVNEQINARLQRTAQVFAQQGVDPSKVDIDWKELAESQREAAVRDVKAGLLLERISEAEAVEPDEDEVDAEVERYAQTNRITLSAARKKLAEDGALDRIQSHLRNEKTLQILFDEAEKVDPPEEAAPSAPESEESEPEAEQPGPQIEGPGPESEESAPDAEEPPPPE